MKAMLASIRRHQFVRFVTVSGIQAIGNYGTYLVVLRYADWPIAFLAALAVGIAIQTTLQIKTTFKGELNFRVASFYILFQLFYAVLYGTLLAVVIASGVAPAFAPLVVLLVMTPLNFLVSRMIILGRAAS